MTIGAWLDLILALLLTLNLLVLCGAVAVSMRKVAALSERLDGAIAEIRRDTVAALQDTHTALTKLAELSGSLEELVKKDVAPTLTVTRSALSHIDTTLQGVADATSAVRRIAAGAEALTTPAAVSEAVGKMMQRPGGRSALIAGVALAVIKTVTALKRHRASGGDSVVSGS